MWICHLILSPHRLLLLETLPCVQSTLSSRSKLDCILAWIWDSLSSSWEGAGREDLSVGFECLLAGLGFYIVYARARVCVSALAFLVGGTDNETS